MASGTLALIAAAATLGLQAACGRRNGIREGAGMAALLALAVALLALVPHVDASDGFKAHTFGQFLSAFVHLASWPAHTALGLVLFVPSAAFVLCVFADCPKVTDPRWLNVAALVWTLGQIVALAAGRAQWPLQSRYTDVLIIGSTVNLVSALWLFRRAGAMGARTAWRALLLAAWLGVFAISFIHPQRHLQKQIDERRDIAIAEAGNLRGYLATGDESFLAGPPALQIPYFDPLRLRALLDTPEIRSSLPPELTGNPPPHPWVEKVKAALMRFGPVALGLGLVLLLGRVFRGLGPVTRALAASPADSS
jgi:hypothetical protein